MPRLASTAALPIPRAGGRAARPGDGRRHRPSAAPLPAALLLALACAVAMAIDVESQGPNRDGGIVSRIVDGDTIEVETVTRTVTVRYIGVDAPERRDPYGKEAEAANGELIEGRRVCLEEDQSETDGYGRLLRYVHVDDGACDGTFVNAELVRRGLALAAYYPPDTRHLHLFARLQGEAVRGCRGLWSALPGCAGRAAFLPISHALAARPTGTAR